MEVSGSAGKRDELLLSTPKVIKQSEQAEDRFQLHRASPSWEDTGFRGDGNVFLMYT